MGAEEGFRKGPCMVDILWLHDKKVRSEEKKYILRKKKPAVSQRGRGSESRERLVDSGRLPATTTQQDKGAK